MKTRIFTLFMLLSHVVWAQRENLDRLPQRERDSLLVVIANEYLTRFTEGYLRPGNKPTIDDIGRTNDKEIEKSYIGRQHYAVSYQPTEAEKERFKNVYFSKQPYLVKVFILADVGKVTKVRYIDDGDWIIRYALEKVSEKENKKREKNKRIFTGEYKGEGIIVKYSYYEGPPPSMSIKAQNWAIQKALKWDSISRANVRFIKTQDSLRGVTPERSKFRQDSIQNSWDKKIKLILEQNLVKYEDWLQEKEKREKF